MVEVSHDGLLIALVTAFTTIMVVLLPLIVRNRNATAKNANGLESVSRRIDGVDARVTALEERVSHIDEGRKDGSTNR